MDWRGKITCLRWRLGRIPHLLVLSIVMAPGLATAAAPVIDSFEANPIAVLPGNSISLVVEAHDPDCSDSCDSGCGQYLRADLTQWDSSLGTFEDIDNGTSLSPYSASAVWRAPSQEGSVTITVTLFDSATMMCGGRQTVSGTVIVEVSETAGQEPIITSLVIDRNPVLVGGSAILSATAEDPQGDPISFTWSAVLGTTTGGSPGTARYTAPTGPGNDTITCTVSDPGGASSSRALAVTVTTAQAESVLEEGLVTPHDVTVNRWGDLVVADRAAGGLIFINPATGEKLKTVAVPRVSSVGADWLGRLIVGTRTELLILSAEGIIHGILDPGPPLGAVTDVTVDDAGRRIWVLYGSAGRVVAFDEGGSVVGAFGRRGETIGDFREPAALAWSPAGELLVADASLGQALAFDSNGQFIRTIGSFGNGTGEFTRIAGIAVGPENRLYASDAFQSRLQVFDSDGNFSESLGTFGDQMGSFKVPMGLTLLELPPRLAVTSAHSSSIQIFRLDSSVVDLPAATVEPTALNFGEVVVGNTGEPAVVLLTNTGTLPVGIYGLDSPDAFDVETTCEGGLAPGSSCTATVVFHPIRAGRVTGSLTFSCSGQGLQEVALEGTGIPAQAPLATLLPNALNFGAEFIGHTSGTHTITLSNTGGGILDVTTVRIDGSGTPHFAIVADPCTGSVLAAGESCTLGIVFSPTTAGLHDAVLTIESSSSGGPVTAALSGEGLQMTAIPTLGSWGIFLMVCVLALLGWVVLRRRSRTTAAILMVIWGGGTAFAVDPPHWYFDMDCETCHIGHNAAGGGLTVADGNSNLCLSCHTEGGRAGALPILPSHTLATHHYNVTPDASRWGSQMPQNPEMANRIMDGVFVCSTCHDQHNADVANRGRVRLSTPELLTAFGSSGDVTAGGTYSGSGGSSYLLEITIADSHFRYSRDGGATWVGEADIGTDVPLDSGLAVTFSGGTFALGERWRFTASFPFLRLPLDQGDNATGDRFCRECHSLWAQGYEDVEGPSSRWMSHPVGEGLNANGKGYDRAAPLDGDGSVQGVGGGDGNHSNDFNFDAEGLVQCMTCHGIHYADSNTLTEDGP